GVVVSRQPGPLGPIRSRRRAQAAARALRHATPEEVDALAAGAPLPALRRRLAMLAAQRRYEDAARLRDGIAAVEALARELRSLERLRASSFCLVVPAAEAGFRRAVFVAAGRV